MTVFRERTVPVIYTLLPFVRKAPPALLADCEDDMEYLRRIQLVASGKECPSILERAHQFILKAEFPEDILERNGDTNDAIEWNYDHWKVWDVEYLLKEGAPAEAVDLRSAGISATVLKAMSDETSCIPYLKNAEELFKKGSRRGYELAKDLEMQLKEREGSLFASRRIAKLKGLPVTGKKPAVRTNVDTALPIRIRDKILRRDNYRCIFCGSTSQDIKIEANHIIPRSLIRKLHLDQSLLTDEANLCTTCNPCNRSKSDNLAKEDIRFYIEAFKVSGHPNAKIVPFLEIIERLQSIDRNYIA